MSKTEVFLLSVLLLLPCYFHDLSIKTTFDRDLSSACTQVLLNIDNERPIEEGLNPHFRIVCLSGCRNDLSFLPTQVVFTLKASSFVIFRGKPYQRTYAYNRQSGEIVIC